MAVDKAFWNAIRANDYAVPEDSSLPEMTDELLGYLASPDPDLRDEVAYLTLAHWMIRGVYTPDALREMMRKLLPRLSDGIGEQGTDTVFGRSFAALMIGYVINEDTKKAFLEAGEVKEALDAGLRYLAEERDLRGWIEGKGWAHSCAHTADLLWQSGKSRHLDAADSERMLNAIADKFMVRSGYLYVHGEDERMARAVLAVLKRPDASIEMRRAWVNTLLGLMDQTQPGGFDPLVHSAYYNTRNLLRSVYFHLSHADEPPRQVEALKTQIMEGLRRFEH
jgi:hypothetical protein